MRDAAGVSRDRLQGTQGYLINAYQTARFVKLSQAALHIYMQQYALCHANGLEIQCTCCVALAVAFHRQLASVC